MNDFLPKSARSASTKELTALYAVLDRGDPPINVVAPTLALVQPAGAAESGLDAALRPFGITTRVITDGDSEERAAGTATPSEVLALPNDPDAASGQPVLRSTAFVLGGILHGWCVEDFDEHVEPLRQALISTRLRAWSAWCREPAEFAGLHKPGSDSTGVVQFDDGTPTVAKIGSASMIRTETEFIARTNAQFADHGRSPLFPRLRGVHIEGDQGASLMEAVEPAGLSELLFSDAARTQLRGDAGELLAPYLKQLTSWYRSTAADQQPTVADYLYRERFGALRAHPAFQSTFRAFFPEADLDEMFAADALLPGGARVAGYTQACSWLDEAAPGLLPAAGSAVHGDIYMTNMLRRPDGSPVLIDPRTVWEGRDRPDVGFGDPAFDLATLLHGLLPMAAILIASAEGEAHRLFGAEPDPAAAVLDLSSLRLPVQASAELTAMEDHLVELCPGDEPADIVRSRLYIGSASSLAGWLKYERSLGSRPAWLATYAFTLWYLDRAQSLLGHSATAEETR